MVTIQDPDVEASYEKRNIKKLKHAKAIIYLRYVKKACPRVQPWAFHGFWSCQSLGSLWPLPPGALNEEELEAPGTR